jgi:hypothetical protein
MNDMTTIECAADRIAKCEGALKTLWGEVTEAWLLTPTHTEAQNRAFFKTDRAMRELGLLPVVKK